MKVVFSVMLQFVCQQWSSCRGSSSGSGGGEGAMAPPGPVKISHKKDGCQRQPHRFYVSHPYPLPLERFPVPTLPPSIWQMALLDMFKLVQLGPHSTGSRPLSGHVQICSISPHMPTSGRLAYDCNAFFLGALFRANEQGHF